MRAVGNDIAEPRSVLQRPGDRLHSTDDPLVRPTPRLRSCHAIERHGGMSTTYCSQGGLEASAAARHALLDHCDWDERRRDDIALALSEVITNAVLHGGVGPDDELRIDMSVDEQVVGFRVYDRGDGFTRPVLDIPREDHGWGLFIIDRVARSWGVAPAPGGSCVWFEALLDRDARGQ